MTPTSASNAAIYVPPQPIYWVDDGRIYPHILGLTPTTDPETLLRTYVAGPQCQDPCGVLRARQSVSLAGTHPDGRPPVRRRSVGYWRVSPRHGPCRPRPVFAHRDRQPDLAHARPGRRVSQPGDRVLARRGQRLLRWRHRQRHSARDRGDPLVPVDPAVDGARRGLSTPLAAAAGVFCDQHRPVVHRLDLAGPPVARQGAVAARGGIRAGGAARRRLRCAHHRPPPDSQRDRPHHRHLDAGDSRA